MTYSEQRASPRRPTRRQVRLRWAVAEVPAVVRNFAKGGAMLSVEGPPPRGTKATIISDGREIGVTLIWARGGQAGVQFDQPQEMPL